MNPVYLVGAGPGDPDLLTVRAARLVATADLLLHDDLVAAEVLALAGAATTVKNVGKRCGAKSITQEEIHSLMIEGAQSGRKVVRLKSGDPLVFGRAAEEMDALRTAGVEFEIVPGITAAFAAAAALQCSLTDRRGAAAIVFSTAHHSLAREEDHVPAAEPTRIVYMPGRSFAAIAAEWRTAGLEPGTPCIAVSRVSQPDQQMVATTLAELDQVQPGAAPVLLLAGEVFANASFDGTQAKEAVRDAPVECR